MADDLPNAIQGRDGHLQQVHYLRVNFKFDDSLTVKLGTLPDNAVILDGIIGVKDAFNAGNVVVGTKNKADAFGQVSLTSAGITQLTIPSDAAIASDEVTIFLKRDSVATAGSGVAIMTYVTNH